ncbi:DoxX family protein [Leifsonia sp. H3M29-4]|uniref:DoxX family protein n=1 Tax=Salinibacterium metalliresistens TaxID=3031321 RepID=UPI0023D9D7FB|nr:DoxX family protein [Salinibacterium metalliresistens]MDF1477859.1 DoxX family protein [Salinibacterium metalliresistens]
MIIAVWIVSGLLAVVYLGVGAMKLVSPKERLAKNMGWVENASAPVVKLVGALEILGALGLVLPVLLNIAPVLTPLAASGLVAVQLVGIVVHLRRGERAIVPNIVLLLLALFVALARFGAFGAL